MAGTPRIPFNATAKWLALLAVVVVLFFWKVLFTSEFSILAGWEAANQGYAWHQFAVSSVKKGIWPLWDPYTDSGRSFVGEMQTGVFYPLKLILYLWPLENGGFLSAWIFHLYYVLAHLLAAWFMFLLARELGLKSPFAAFVSAVCFGLGGFVGIVGGHQLWDSAIWLPLVFCFFLRALRSEQWSRGLLWAACSGLSLGVATLGGSLHLAMMDALALVGAAVFFACQSPETSPAAPVRPLRFLRSAAVLLMVGLVAFASAAVQLLPSIEYAPQALRWASTWAGPATSKIPYAVLTDRAYEPPRSLFAFLFGYASIGSAEFSPYFGVMPLLLAITGAWQYRRNPWVKYAVGLAILAFLYSLGPFSFLYGLLYLAPHLDLAREPGRFIYLTHFALALLAGFGAQAILASEADFDDFFAKLVRALGMAVLVLLIALGLPTLYGRPEINEWFYVSFIFIALSWCVLLYIQRGNRTWKAQFLLVALILLDLHTFNWTALDRSERQGKNQDYLERLMAGKPLADFFKSQPGLFRVNLDAAYPIYINLGDMFGVQAAWGQAATILLDYLPFLEFPKGLDLLNVRYIAMAGKEGEGRPVYTDGTWKVYENPTACPRAWVVHRVAQVPSSEAARERIRDPNFDPLQVALVQETLETEFPDPAGAPASIRWGEYQADRFELTVNVGSPGLLVLSEIYYPGWKAERNGKPASIYKVDGLLRGVIVTPGENRVVMQYRPQSVLVGAVLSALTFATTLALGGLFCFRKRVSKA